MITTIIFDIGNVLAAFDWPASLRKWGFPEEEYETIADALYRSEDWNEMDRGVLTIEEMLTRFCNKAPQYAEDIRKVIENFADTIHQYPYVKPMIHELKERGYKVYFLSNYGEYTYEKTKGELDFIELMDGGIFSYKMKLIKPDKWIYLALLEKYGIQAEEAVFFDDNVKNVEAACRLGIHGIVFEGYEQAMRELEDLLKE